MTMTFEAADAPAEVSDAYYIPEPNDELPDVKLCAAPGCTNVPELTPTGRVGKFCAEHKAAPKTAGKATSRTGWKKAPEVEAALNGLFAGAGWLVGIVEPFDGDVIKAGSPNVTRELINLAKDDKQLQRYLEWLATPGKYGPLILAVGGMVVPIAIHHGALNLLTPKPKQDTPDTRKE